MTRRLPDPLRGHIQGLYLRSYRPAAPTGLADRVPYPDEILRSMDATDRPFLRTDTHLTDLGSAAVVQAALGRWGLSYDLHEHFDRVDGTVKGDLAVMLGRTNREEAIVLRPRMPSLATFDNRRFLPGNGSNIAILHNPASATRHRIAVVADSFLHQGLKFLAPVFRDVLYLRGPGLHRRTLDRFAPDVVLTGNAERYLSHVTADAAVADILATLARRRDSHPDAAFLAALDARLADDPQDASQREVDALRADLALRRAELAEAALQLKRHRATAAALRERLTQKDARLRAMQTQMKRRQERQAKADAVRTVAQGPRTSRLARLRQLADRLGRRG